MISRRPRLAGMKTMWALGFGIVVLTILIAVAWNVVGPVSMEDVDKRYQGIFREGKFAGKRLDVDGVLLVKEWIETRTVPSRQAFEILAHQLWYNAITSGYQLKLWIEPAVYLSTPKRYGIHQVDDVIFLRIEFKGRNRVLKASFTIEELEDALEPYVIE